jgi:alkylation response protein AidB-like acyl-CoA dehydrogenase
MGLSLKQDESVAAVADSVLRYCASLPAGTAFPELWKGLAELGLFSLPELFGENACAATVAGMEALGRRGIGGPVADTLAFAACAPADLLEPVVSGDTVACLGQLPLVPFPGMPAIHVTEADGKAVLLDIASAEPVDMLAAEPWARATGSTGRELGPFAPWADRYDIAVAGWLVGAGLELVEAASAHAAQRVQFGKTIGEFQAVSAPLARAVMALDASKVLVETAATYLDGGDGRLVTAARWSAARAAEQATVTAHQTYGAFGVLEAGPVYARSRRIRQLASQFPQERPVDAAAALGEGSLGMVGRNRPEAAR